MLNSFINFASNLITRVKAESISSQFSAVEWQADENNTDMLEILKQVQSIMLYVAGGLAVLAIVYAALQYATAGGDEAKIGTAKKTLTYAILGVVLIMVFYLILLFAMKIIPGYKP